MPCPWNALLSLLHPYLRVADIELHHINGLDHILIAKSKIKTLQGLLLASMPNVAFV
jgi:hypothetical protein